MSGELDTLLMGEKTGVMSLSLVLLGVDVVMDATLQRRLHHPSHPGVVAARASSARTRGVQVL